MSEETTTTTTTPADLWHAGPVANPRRLRLGRDGRPLPLLPRDDDHAA